MAFPLWFTSLVIAAGASLVTAESPIEIRVDAPASIELGDALPISVSLVNVSHDVVFLSRTYGADGMAAQLRVVLERDDCQVVLVDFQSSERGRESIVPLYPNERLELAMPPLNKNVLWQEIWSVPGNATMRVQYRFSGREEDGIVAESREEPITFRPARMEAIVERLESLRKCVQSETVECLHAIAYFAAVRDDRAADLLIHLLELRPYKHFVARAIANQARSADAVILDALAENPIADGQFLRTAARAIRERRDGACAKVEK